MSLEIPPESKGTFQIVALWGALLGVALALREVPGLGSIVTPILGGALIYAGARLIQRGGHD